MFKKQIVALLSCAIIIGFSSCSTDFDIAAPYKNITAVYGLLNLGDSAHYIRIQKAFLDENASALVMAKEADSNFYDNLNVTMDELNGSGTVMATFPLVRTTLPKDSGIFFTEPQFVYKFNRQLNPSFSYRLSINNPQNGTTITGITQVIDTASNQFEVYDFNFKNYVLKFPKSQRDADFILQVKPPLGFEPGQDKYLEAFITFLYQEKDGNTGIESSHSVEWKFDSTVSNNKFINLTTKQSSFYSFLSSSIPKKMGVTRVMRQVDMTVWMAGNDYARYVTITRAQTGGLTSGQISPVFSNLKGENVLGIYNTRAFKTRQKIDIDQITRDSLISNSLTRELNFVNQF